MENKVLSKLVANGAYTWNGAVSNSTTGFDPFGTTLDYFAKAGTYVNRSQEDVDASMGRIFRDDAETALKVVFGLRLITRKPKDVEGVEESQTGYGRRDEFFKAVKWLTFHNPEMLYRNLHLIPVFGCWKDFLTEPLIDVLDRKKVYQLIKDNLDNALLRKYLPQIRSKKHTRTERDRKRIEWAKGLCSFLGISPSEYRKLKSNGAGHIWQKQMSAQKWDDINFNGIPGKAMLLHTSRKGKDKQTVFERHGQVSRLTEWVLKQKSVKFTGYPYELLKAAQKGPSMVQKVVYDKQFETLIEPMRNHKLGNVLSCLDLSGSMTWCHVAPNVTPLDVCLSMGIVFSALNTGYFKDAVCGFSDRSVLGKLEGSFCDRVNTLTRGGFLAGAMGSTNFQSVIDLLIKIRTENPEIPVDQYPETLLVISDMQFNPTSGNTETNYQAARKKLEKVGLNEVRIIWWTVNGAGTDFPSQMNDKGVYMISGFDPVNIKALMGLDSSSEKKDFNAKEKVEETPLDGMKNFLSQPIFSLIN